MSTLQSSQTAHAVRGAVDAAAGIALLSGVLEDAASQAVLLLLRELTVPSPHARAVAAAFARSFYHLAAVSDDEATSDLSDAWQAHLTARLLDDANPWSTRAEAGAERSQAPGMLAQARHDLAALRRLFEIDADSVWGTARQVVTAELPALADAWVPWKDLARSTHDGGNAARTEMRHRLARSNDWASLAEDLAAHWSRHGTGIVAHFRALRWQGREDGLSGIAHPDPVRLADLVGYPREQGALTANVERLMAGLPAQDALLYGAPGTGKSSTVKAIANAYADRGLRLIEVRKEDLGDLPHIAALLRGRAPRFLVFVDDLSFEEHETEYKALKALLEGTAELRPANMLIYATTNRRNLIRENFADRGVPSDDVHGRDTMQEKVSLAARFGLRVTFAAPDQETYLLIAASLAHGRGLALADDELRRRALLWERQHPGRSGRTARRFVDDLDAEINSGA